MKPLRPAHAGEEFGNGWVAVGTSWQEPASGRSRVRVRCLECDRCFERNLGDMRNSPPARCRACSYKQPRGDRYEPKVGTRFGLWTSTGPRVGDRLPVVCACGWSATVGISSLVGRRSRSCVFCGWVAIGDANRKHGDSGARLYVIWCGMRERCRTPSCTGYDSYGGRGITVCSEWGDYEVFREWAHDSGYTDQLTIDRIDPDGHYTPANCRWITASENSSRSRPRGSAKPLVAS